MMMMSYIAYSLICKFSFSASVAFDMEGVQHRIFPIHQRENHIACLAVIRQPLIFLRRSGRRLRMRVPVAQRNQSVGTHILDCCQLFLRVQAEMFIGMVDVRQQVDLLDDLVRSVVSRRRSDRRPRPAVLFWRVPAFFQNLLCSTES